MGSVQIAAATPISGATTNPAKRPRKLYVEFSRPSAVQAQRLSLPVCQHEQEIMEAIHAHDVVLITSATGSGKTTQLPQFLLEDGFGTSGSPYVGKVAVTQPRRVAAVTCAKRVAYELGQKLGEDVGYRIRHESRGGEKVEFVTDGVLLREVESDILLRNYSAVVIDEVHERSLNTDLLLSFLSRTNVLRTSNLHKGRPMSPLKLIIMSATLDVEGLFSGRQALFPNPTVIRVPSRQHPVVEHFAKRTAEDYVEETIRKAIKVHRRLPPGGLLIFLTGRQEVEQVCMRLREELKEPVTIPDSDTKLGIKVQPFYALLSDSLQRQIFLPTAANVRKIVVATNIAETSVTVPDISYVIDCGRVKQKSFDKRTHLSSYRIQWTSQASAAQRAGRAGRTGPGHCYRLYSSAVFDQQMAEYGEAEIERTPVESVVLRLRAMGIRHVHKFPFVTAPDKQELEEAEALLTRLGALHDADEYKKTLGVTRIGRQLAQLPLPPRLGRMILAARDVRRYAVRIAGVLTVGTVLDRSAEDWQEKHSVFLNERSDLLTELGAVCAAEHSGGKDRAALRGFCSRFALHFKSTEEVLKVARQLEDVLGIKERVALNPLNQEQEEELCKAVLSGFADKVARRLTGEEGIAEGIVPKRIRGAYRVHGGRVGFVQGQHKGDMVVFSELAEVEVKRRRAERDDYEEEEKETKVVLRGVTSIEPSWLPELAQGMCTFKWDNSQKGVYDVKRDMVLHSAKVTYGNGWPVGMAKVGADLLAEANEESAMVFATALLGGRVLGVKVDRAAGHIKQAAKELRGVCSKEELRDFVRRRGIPLRWLGEDWIAAVKNLVVKTAESHALHVADQNSSSENEY